MNYCKDCGNKTILMSGQIILEPDAEPYESGVEETIDLHVDDFIIAHYCEKCVKVTDTFNE